MANRPIYVPLEARPFVQEKLIEFQWFPGMAVSQAQKSILSWHQSAATKGIAPILEISSKSTEPLGVRLSAFNLMLREGQLSMSVECAFQGSKVFRSGGPFTELYSVSSREARGDERLRDSGPLVAFRFLDQEFPLKPVTAFYDWLYLKALQQNQALAESLLAYQAFSDIAFNPKKSLNCQARAAALYVGLSRARMLPRISNREDYLALVQPATSQGKLL